MMTSQIIKLPVNIVNSLNGCLNKIDTLVKQTRPFFLYSPYLTLYKTDTYYWSQRFPS